MNHLPLFEIRVEHPYYTSGVCPDALIEPTEAGWRIARNHRLVVKPRPGAVLVLTPVKPDQTLQIPFTAGATMMFHLCPRDRRMRRNSDLGAHDSMTAPLYTGAGIAAGQGGKLAMIDQPETPLPQGALANIEICELAAMTPGAGFLGFDVSIAPRSARWAYYVVTDVDPGDVTLVDNDPTAGATPLAFDADNNPRDLAAEPDPSDSVAAELAARYPELRRLRFVTSEPIPCREAPRKYLELHIDGLRQAGALPNPSFDNLATVEMTIDSAPRSEPSLVRLIKHITQSLSTP